MDAEERKKHDDVIPFSPEGPFLVPNIPGGAKVPFEPLANSLLFAQFSDMAPTGESFLGWANTYGRLIDIET
jgi:hypothetical protein